MSLDDRSVTNAVLEQQFLYGGLQSIEILYGLWTCVRVCIQVDESIVDDYVVNFIDNMWSYSLPEIFGSTYPMESYGYALGDVINRTRKRDQDFRIKEAVVKLCLFIKEDYLGHEYSKFVHADDCLIRLVHYLNEVVWPERVRENTVYINNVFWQSIGRNAP